MSRALTAPSLAFLLAAPFLFLPSVPARADAASAAVYKAKCASCHGADGRGQTAVGKKMKLRDLREPAVQKQSNAVLTKIITDGKAKMPGYDKKLKPEQIKAQVALMRELVAKK
jgi:mono/diheme cytochrome c family protein